MSRADGLYWLIMTDHRHMLATTQRQTAVPISPKYIFGKLKKKQTKKHLHFG